MLIQITFFILMLFGVAALTVDMGLVHLTQAQMQTAADAAAVEGLRGGDPAMMAQQVPAGPNLALSGGVGGDLNALQTVGAAGQYYAALQPNIGNAISGDVATGSFEATEGADLTSTDGTNVASGSHPWQAVDVGHAVTIAASTGWTAGTYQIASVSLINHTATLSGPACASPPCKAGLWAESGPWENPDYSRVDFNYGSGQSYLVRLRRTDHRNDGVTERVPGVSSSGESVPLLFGRAGPIQKQTDPTLNPTGYSPRVDGITVRATAIAAAKPALRVGLSGPALPIGVAPFVLTQDCWNGLTDGVAVTLSADLSGNLTSPYLPSCTAFQAGNYAQPAQTVGTAIMTVYPPPPLSDGPAYAPIYARISGRDLVIGFGFLQVAYSNGGATLVITRTSSPVAVSNATAVVSGGFPVQGTDLTTVLALTATLPGALLAPVIAR